MNSLTLSTIISFPLGIALGLLRFYTGFPFYLAIPAYVLMGVVIAIACRMMLSKATKNKPESR